MKHFPIRKKHFSPFGGDAEGRAGLKKTLLLTFVIFLSTFAFSQQYGWTDISANMPELGGFNDVHVIGDEIWITGGNAEVFYSPDGGETFQIQSLPENSGITSSIFMKNNQEGYVVTFSGNILKTENGGITWVILHEPGGALNSVHFPPNSNTGYTCGTNGTVWQFDDVSITDISPSNNASNLQSICCPVDNTDIKLCGQTTIARHKNNTWANLQFYDSTIFYNSIFFINNTTGWCVGIDGIIIIVVDGFSWVGQTSNTTKTLNDVFFINSLEGWVAGSEVLLHTTDGGKTWTEELESFTPGKALTGVYFTSANNGYVVGNYTVLKYTEITSEANNDATLSSIQINSEELAGFTTATLNYQFELPTGTSTVPTVAATPNDANATIVITQAPELPGTATILVTAEDGETRQTYTLEFTVAQNAGWVDISANIPGNPDFSDVFFVSDDEGWISVSSGPEIYHTTDGGATFEIQETSLGTSTGAIYMIDENEGYTGGGSGFVYRTLDGGQNWTFHGAISSTLTDMDFANDTTGYACGNNGAVFSITPEGVTNLNSGLSTNLGGITSPSENKVWVCGGGTISYFDGTTFTFQSGPGGTYNDIFFLNQQEGWIVGNNGIIGHTENGGEAWYRQINPDPEGNSLYGLFFLNENEGWAIGAQGTILKTTNGGDNWVLDTEGSTLAGTKFLRGVYFTSPTNGYVVGNEKTLLKYTEVSGVGDEIVEKLQFDIFPNPANNKVEFRSSEFATKNCSLKICDLNGKTLIEKHIPSGTETVEIDVSNLASGVYFCKILTDKGNATKKLIIQK